jgi:hypothetical protein
MSRTQWMQHRLTSHAARPTRQLFLRSTVRIILAALVPGVLPADALARTVWRCVLDGTVSLSTAAEPGSECTPQTLDDDAAALPNLWGTMGDFHGTLYQREQDGKTVYGTRKLPGSKPLFGFSVATPAHSPAHAGLGQVGPPRMDLYRSEFRTAARRTGVDEAWLRAIAHAESYFDASAVSEKGARGVMQLMPDVISDYAVENPHSARDSILAGASLLKALDAHYGGDLVRVAAAYKAGIGTVDEYDGVPPYEETRIYVAKVTELYANYRKAMGLVPRPMHLVPAQ